MPSPPRYVVEICRVSDGCKGETPNVVLLAAVASRTFLIKSLAWYRNLDFSSCPLTPQRSRPSNGISMTYATSAPATSGGNPGSPVCFSLVGVVMVFVLSMLQSPTFALI
jgi:hypothetical protein